jgi:succinoglycan biosynthesis transport protein ExoP
MENTIMSEQLIDQPIAAEHSSSSSAPSPWEVLWQRKSYVALGAVVGLALGVLYWSMSQKVYESKAQIWVLRKQSDTHLSAEAALGGNSYNAAEDFLSTHRTLIQSTVVVSDAVSKGRLTERAAFRTSSRPARDLAKALTVSRDRDKSAGGNSNSQVLNISFRCSNAEDCAPVLSAVIDSYRNFLDNRTQDSAKQTLDLIEQARNVLEKELETKERDLDEFRRKTPILWKNAYGTSLYQDRLGLLDAQRTSLLIRRARLRATLDEVDEALKQGCSRADLLEIVSASSGQEPMMTMMGSRGSRGMTMESGGASAGGATAHALANSLEQELIGLQLEEGRLLEYCDSEHPHVKAVRYRLQTVRSLLAPNTTPQAQTPDQRERDNRAKERLADLKLAKIKQELADSERSLKSLNALWKEEMNEAKKAFPVETQEASYRRAIKRSQELFDNINQRLRELNVVRSSRGFETQVITPPTEAEKVAPRGSLILPLSLFLGLLFGSGLAYLAEVTDKSFRSPEDVRRRLGLPIMGVIPLVKANAKTAAKDSEGEPRVSPTLFTWHRPKSKEAESYRAVRTALYFSTRGQGRTLLQVTSPNQGDGKSTLAANLAVSIAQSGKSILLVDGDLRRPHVGRLFGISQEVGFAAVLGGLAEPNEAISQTAVPGLSVLPAGVTPPNPAELLTGPRLREVLDWLRERYDYVIVDSPPLLAVTDPGVVAPQVDGVIMTLRPSKKNRVEAKRAKEILTNLGVTIFGLVVNALDLTKSHDSYGYYYGYGYYSQGYYKEDSEDADGNDEPQPSRVEHLENGESAHGDNGTPLSGH